MKIALALAALVFLTGCASKELVKKSSEYGLAHEIIKTQYGEFRVYEHPTGKRVAVSSTLASAFGQGFVKGATFGAANIRPSEGGYQEAAQAYIDKHDVFEGCRITNGYLLQEPVFEFVLEC